MRVLVTGSRDWTNAGRIRAAMFDLSTYCPVGTRPTLVSGACPTGADRLAEYYAEMYGWRVERHPAKWEQFGKRAGFLRNAEMVALGADVCLAFIRNESKGASMTARLAEEAGIRTIRYTA